MFVCDVTNGRMNGFGRPCVQDANNNNNNNNNNNHKINIFLIVCIYRINAYTFCMKIQRCKQKKMHLIEWLMNKNNNNNNNV